MRCTAGNVRSVAHTAGSGVYTVETGRDVSACQYSADVTGVKDGTTIEEPTDAGLRHRLPVGDRDAGDRADVQLGRPPRRGRPPFSLLIAC